MYPVGFGHTKTVGFTTKKIFFLIPEDIETVLIPFNHFISSLIDFDYQESHRKDPKRGLGGPDDQLTIVFSFFC